MTTVSSGGAMLQREEENEADVRREDQDKINEFASLNARLHEIRDEAESLKKKLQGIDDASTELMMGNGDKVLIMLGEAFFESSEQDATELCEEQVENFQATIEVLNDEETTIVERQSQLKKDLYGRFGKSIQLEDS